MCRLIVALGHFFAFFVLEKTVAKNNLFVYWMYWLNYWIVNKVRHVQMVLDPFPR